MRRGSSRVAGGEERQSRRRRGGAAAGVAARRRGEYKQANSLLSPFPPLSVSSAREKPRQKVRACALCPPSYCFASPGHLARVRAA